MSLNEIGTLSDLYQNGTLKAPVSAAHGARQSLNDRVSHLRYDITKLHVDVLVNAANKSLLGGGGVDGAIHRAAGREMVRECRTLHGCDTGSAKITSAYNLPCNKVIHAVGPVYDPDHRQHSEEQLRGCYRTSLELAVRHHCKSVAFSAISTGVYGYPSVDAAETAISEVRSFLTGPQGIEIDRVVFCSFEMKDVNAYIATLPYDSSFTIIAAFSLTDCLPSRYFPPVSASRQITPSRGTTPERKTTPEQQTIPERKTTPEQKTTPERRTTPELKTTPAEGSQSGRRTSS